MSLTKNILDLAKELESKYKDIIDGIEDIFEVEGNPFYIKAVANEMMKAAMTSLTLKSEYQMELVSLRNNFLNGKMNEDDFCLCVLSAFGDDSYYSETETNISKHLLEVYSMMKKGADFEITLFGDTNSSELMEEQSHKVLELFYSTLPYDKEFLESNIVFEDLIEDFVMDKINYDELISTMNDFYNDLQIRKEKVLFSN